MRLAKTLDQVSYEPLLKEHLLEFMPNGDLVHDLHHRRQIKLCILKSSVVVGSWLDIVGKMFVGHPASFAFPLPFPPSDRLADRWVSTFRETDKVASD